MDDPRRPDGRAFHALLDLLREAEAGFLDPARGGGEDVDRAEAYRNLLDVLSASLDFYLRNDPERPHFDPIVTPHRKLGGDNADALYDFAPLRGDRSYRVRGRRGDDLYVAFTVYGGASESESHIVANLGTPDLVCGRGGDFELVLSPRERDERAPNHLRLAPDTQSLIVRQYFHDRPRARPVSLAIEPLDDPPRPAPLSGEEVARRLRAAAAFVRGWTRLAPIPLPTDPAQWNTLIPPLRASASTGHWSTPDNVHAFGFYRLEPDEVLLVRGRSPECVYWSCHLWNACMATFDYEHYRTRLNDAQVARAADGSWQLAIAHRDPGVPNWIETAGHRTGFVYFRWLLPVELPAPLETQVLKLADLAS